jgi:hypothetical protein
MDWSRTLKGLPVVRALRGRRPLVSGVQTETSIITQNTRHNRCFHDRLKAEALRNTVVSHEGLEPNMVGSSERSKYRMCSVRMRTCDRVPR